MTKEDLARISDIFEYANHTHFFIKEQMKQPV